jgi:thioredoxin-related protein
MQRLLPILLLLTAVLPARAQDASVPAEGVAWQPFEQAVDSAEADDRYIIIDIYAPWCGWCKKMQRTVYTADSVQTYLNEHFIPTRLDATAKKSSVEFRGKTFPVPQLARKLGLRGTPTTVFLKPDGSYLARRPGFVETDDFLTMLRFIGSNAHEEQSFQEYAQSK